MKPGLFTFGVVLAQSQVLETCSFAKASPKVKIPGSEWLRYFLNRSNRQTVHRMPQKIKDIHH
jgi:hypothetical protein